MSTRPDIGPRSKAVTTCFPCEFLTHRDGQSYCRHEPMNGAHIGHTGGTYETPPTCPLLPAARLALLVSLASTLCRKCGRDVEPERECYAIPTCFACLPPPPPLPAPLSFAEWQKKRKEEGASAVAPMVTREGPTNEH